MTIWFILKCLMYLIGALGILAYAAWMLDNYDRKLYMSTGTIVGIDFYGDGYSIVVIKVDGEIAPVCIRDSDALCLQIGEVVGVSYKIGRFSRMTKIKKIF